MHRGRISTPGEENAQNNTKKCHENRRSLCGGMCQGAFCESFTGGLMVIGFAHGKEGAPDKEVPDRVMTLSSAMQTQFGSLSCSSLLGVDMATPEGVQLAGKPGLYQSFCPKLVEATVRKLQAIL